ncbi:type II toxin-antitoxin system Phd/YefM family antitoxin [Xenorhabdus taiwanensis]
MENVFWRYRPDQLVQTNKNKHPKIVYIKTSISDVMEQINIYNAETNLSRIVQEVACTGEPVVITKERMDANPLMD